MEVQSYEKKGLSSSFVTLTYRDESLPVGRSLCPRDPSLWLKRLRKSRPGGPPLRYYLVGEYGEADQRPHYHVALFGFPPCDAGSTIVRKGDKLQRPTCCQPCRSLYETWGLGAIFSGSLEPASANYISGYVTKGLTNESDPVNATKLAGRHPEFSRMSLKPGIGAEWADRFAETVEANGLIRESGQLVPRTYMEGPVTKNLPRYLSNRVRKQLLTEEGIKHETNVWLQKKYAESQAKPAEVRDQERAQRLLNQQLSIKQHQKRKKDRSL